MEVTGGVRERPFRKEGQGHRSAGETSTECVFSLSWTLGAQGQAAGSVPGGGSPPACRWPSSDKGDSATARSLVRRTLIPPRDPTFLTSSKPDHLPAASAPHTVKLGVRVSTQELGEQRGHKHSVH